VTSKRTAVYRWVTKYLFSEGIFRARGVVFSDSKRFYYGGQFCGLYGLDIPVPPAHAHETYREAFEKALDMIANKRHSLERARGRLVALQEDLPRVCDVEAYGEENVPLVCDVRTLAPDLLGKG